MNIQKLHISPSTPLKAAAAALILLAIAVSLTAYPLPAQAQALSTDATLSALTVSPNNIIGFQADRTSYQVGVASTVTEATVAATPNAANAIAFITPTDSNTGTDGHQVALSAGRNPVTIRVTSQDGTVRTYTVSINRGVTDNFGWKADDDLDGLPQLATGNNYRGLAEHNGIFWISASRSRTLAAYQQDGSRLPARDIDLHSTNIFPSYLWTNGTTIWVADPIALKLFAYRLSDGNRQESRDITLNVASIPLGTISFAGIWSDGTTIWVAESSDGKLYAYALDGGARQESNEFDLHSSNDHSTGIWSDGYTMWVADTFDDKLYAYFLETGQRRARLDFNTLRGIGNHHSFGITSDGTTMWVLDSNDRKVYSYNLLLSDDSTLSALTVRPKDIIGFDAERDSYQLGVDSTVTRATVTGTPNDANAIVSYSGTDASSGTRGHQVDLSAGRNPVTVTVTAEDGTTQDYTLSINRGVADDFGWNAGNDLDGLATTTDNPVGAIAEHDGIFWIAPFFRGNVLAYRQDGSRLPSRDISRSANANITYMFTDGQTIWAADGVDHKLYAYQLSDDSRQEPKDITLHTDNAQGAGIWSDGTTMWVADNTDHKLYAYSLDGGVRQQSREFDLASGNDESRGIWSDGNTVWVTDSTDQKLYAYTLQDGDRQTGRDFNTLQRGREQQTSRHHIGRQHHVGHGQRRGQSLLLQHAAGAAGQRPGRHRGPADSHHLGRPAAKRHHRLPVPGQQRRRRLLEPGLDHHAGQQRPHHHLHRQEPGQHLRARYRGARPGGRQILRGGQVRRHTHGPALHAPDARKPGHGGRGRNPLPELAQARRGPPGPRHLLRRQVPPLRVLQLMAERDQRQRGTDPQDPLQPDHRRAGQPPPLRGAGGRRQQSRQE